MRIVKSVMLLVGVVTIVAVGCDGKTEDDGGGKAGSGAAGAGAGGSKAGSSGSGGSKADSSGSSSGGQAVDGGAAASSAGAPETGLGGIAGGVSGLFDPQCEPGREPGFEMPSGCNFAATCAALGCGDGFSRFGADGCLRYCEKSADCGAGQRCRFTALSGNECGTSSVVESCSSEDGICSCTESADCSHADICVDEERFPASLDCAVEQASCVQLNDLDFVIGEDSEGAPPEKTAAIEACWTKMTARRAELACPQ